MCVCMHVCVCLGGGVWKKGVKFGPGSEGWFPSSGMNHVLSLEFWAHRVNVEAGLVLLERRLLRECQTLPLWGTLGKSQG